MDDLISRQAALEVLNRLAREKFSLRDEFQYYLNALIDVEDKIKALPSAQPERKKGRWTKKNACEFCGFQPWFERDIHTLSFCPNCGADMRGEQDEY